MNKRQKKKRLEREKKEVIKGLDYIEGVFYEAAKEMRKHFETMPDNQDKIYHDFFITGFLNMQLKCLMWLKIKLGALNEI